MDQEVGIDSRRKQPVPYQSAQVIGLDDSIAFHQEKERRTGEKKDRNRHLFVLIVCNAMPGALGTLTHLKSLSDHV